MKSTGSFIPQLIYRYYIIDDKKPIDSGGSKQKSNNFEFVLGAGYYHTFVIKHNFYFSLGLTPGAGYIFTKLTTTLPTGSVETNQQNGILRLDGRIGLGYNSQRFFSGIYMRASAETYNQENTSVVNKDERLAFQIFFGYWLRAPAWLRDKVNYISDKVGM